MIRVSKLNGILIQILEVIWRKKDLQRATFSKWEKTRSVGSQVYNRL